MALPWNICTTFFSILGGITGYIIGYVFWDVIGVKIVDPL